MQTCRIAVFYLTVILLLSEGFDLLHRENNKPPFTLFFSCCWSAGGRAWVMLGDKACVTVGVPVHPKRCTGLRADQPSVQNHFFIDLALCMRALSRHNRKGMLKQERTFPKLLLHRCKQTIVWNFLIWCIIKILLYWNWKTKIMKNSSENKDRGVHLLLAVCCLYL